MKTSVKEFIVKVLKWALNQLLSEKSKSEVEKKQLKRFTPDLDKMTKEELKRYFENPNNSIEL